MSDLLALYQEVILDHNKQPRNFGELSETAHRAEGNNPLCGDRLTVELILEAGRVSDIGGGVDDQVAVAVPDEVSDDNLGRSAYRERGVLVHAE